MPIKIPEREYRTMPMLLPGTNKRFDTDYYIEGYATTFDDPYVLYSCDGIDYKEVIDRHALDNADITDVIMQYDHQGRVFARTNMGANKPATLILEPDNHGLFTAADLSHSEGARSLHNDITEGLIHQMSWCFVVGESKYDAQTHTRTIMKIPKVYDVSAVSIPANPSTDISARSAKAYFDGVIEAEQQELLHRQRLIEITKLKLKLGGIN